MVYIHLHDGLCLRNIAKSLVTQLACFCIFYKDVQDSNLASPIITIDLKKIKIKIKNQTNKQTNKTKTKQKLRYILI